MSHKSILSIVVVGAFAILPVSAGEARRPSARTVEISVTESGFSPGKVTVKRNEEVTLAFKRTSDKTCATEVILHVNDKNVVEIKLPLNEVVPVTVKFSKAGELSYACGMNMHKGVIVVQ